MSLWWLQPGWTSAMCACGKKIWPEGDPDWGECYECRCRRYADERTYHYVCEICGMREAVTDCAGYAVCSEECCGLANDRAVKDAVNGVDDA